MSDEKTHDNVTRITVDPTTPDEPEVETTKFEWGGEEWTVPVSDADWSWEVLEAFETGQNVAFVRSILGRQFPRFARHKDASTRGVREMANAIHEAINKANKGN